VTIPIDRDQFLAELTVRNRGLIAEQDQHQLSDATFLVAGCGSTGGATIDPLVRAGAMRFLLAEPGTYELHNLNRQRATVDAIGVNKARWLAGRAMAINPYLQIAVHEEGVSAENVADLCQRSTLIIDAVDVTTLEGLAAKCALHDAASVARRPVISAYDLAYRQLVRVYDYRRPQSPLHGAAARVRQARTPTDALARLIPFWAIPLEIVGEIERLQGDPGASISQLGCAADLFGALVVPLALELLAGRRVTHCYTLDLKDPCLPRSRRAARRVATVLGLMRAQARRWRRS
jgi:molybdopterin/thiamine biosynthesis adenylyltransferase